MTIKLVDDLSDYEHVETFYPYLALTSDHYPTVEKLGLIPDPADIFDYVSQDENRTYAMVFESAGHERDSSGDTYTLYRKIDGR